MYVRAIILDIGTTLYTARHRGVLNKYAPVTDLTRCVRMAEKLNCAGVRFDPQPKNRIKKTIVKPCTSNRELEYFASVCYDCSINVLRYEVMSTCAHGGNFESARN